MSNKVIRKIFCGLTVISMLFSITAFATTQTSSPKEQYVWIACLSQLPLFLAHDYPALKQEANRLGVNITFAGPNIIDVAAENRILDQWIAKKPAGILFMPFGNSSNALIDKAIAAGIPVVAVDGDAPQSRRVAFSGTDWEALGREQALLMGKLLNDQGTVMLSAIIPSPAYNDAMRGYKSVMDKQFPHIKILGVNNDYADPIEAAKLATKTIQKYPDISGFSGIDDNSCPGIANAIRSAGKIGKIKVTCVDDNPDTITAIQDGIVDTTLVQKREAFETFGLRVLYYYNHPGYSIGEKFAEAGFNMVPSEMYTDTLVINKNNLSKLLKIHQYVAEVNKTLK